MKAEKSELIWILLCDFNKDGCVDKEDANLLQSHFGLRRGEANYKAMFDLNRDGIIDIFDAVIFGKYYGECWSVRMLHEAGYLSAKSP